MKTKEQKNTREKKKEFVVITLITLFLFLAVLNIETASAIGITPGRTTVLFEPGLENTVQFKIINNEHKDMNVLLSVEGEFSEFVTLYNKLIEFKSSDEEKIFKYSFKLPLAIEKPGIHEAKIIAMELPKDIDQPGTYVGATIAVATQLYIKVPYPGKYLELRMDVQESDVNETTKFVVSATNLGEQKIARAYAIIDIISKTGERLATVKTATQEIDSEQRKELVTEWKVDVNPGTYLARATVVYDEHTAEIEKIFNIGTLRLELIDVVVEDFRLGGIAKFNILLENKWGEQIKDVYAQVLIFDDASKKIADSKSANENIPALSRKNMFAYWDTAGIDIGDYKGKIVMHYLEQETEKEILVRVRENSLIVDIIGVTAKAIARQGAGISSSFLLISIIIVLILINVAWFLFLRKKLTKTK